MLKLWGRSNSSNAMKVLWLLDELGLPFEMIPAGLSFGRNDTDHYAAMNPFRLVPVLQDGAVPLFESNTILRYLCTVHAPGSDLYPTEPAARAGVEAWMDAQLATLPSFGMVFQQLIRLAPQDRDDAVLAAALSQSAATFGVFDGRLTGRDWLAGDTMTLADVSFGVFVHRWFALPMVRPNLPGLRRYYERLLARPAYVARCTAALS